MLKRIVVGLAAPVLAIVMAMLITIGILLLSGNSVSGFLTTIFSVPAPRNVVNIINNSSVLYLSALAAAIGFRMNLFNIGVEGQYRVAVFAAAAFAGQGWLPGPLNVIVAVLDRDRQRRRLGRDRRRPQGHPGRLGGDLHDHAERHRGVPDGLPAAQVGRHRRQQHPDQAAAQGLLGAGHPAHPGCPQRGARPRRDRPAGRRRLRRAAGPVPLRLRAPRDRRLRDRRGGQRHRRTPDGGDLDGHLRRDRRPGGPAAALRRHALLRHHVPVRPRVRRHRGRPAGPQQPGRHRVRLAAVRVPRRAEQPAGDQRRRLQRHRRRSPRGCWCSAS